MGTYNKTFTIKWLNFNPILQQIEAEYGVLLILDTGEMTELPSFRVKLDSYYYNKFFNVVTSDLPDGITVGEFLLYLTSVAAQMKNPDFVVDPQLVEKFGNMGEVLFQPEIMDIPISENEIQ